MTVPGPSGRSLSVSVTEMFGQDLLSLLLTPFCEARSWKLGIFPSLFCPMPLHRALRSKGRSGPRTPGPSARLLQRRICRTGSALPESRRFAASQVALAARGACGQREGTALSLVGVVSESSSVTKKRVACLVLPRRF